MWSRTEICTIGSSRRIYGNHRRLRYWSSVVSETICLADALGHSKTIITSQCIKICRRKWRCWIWASYFKDDVNFRCSWSVRTKLSIRRTTFLYSFLLVWLKDLLYSSRLNYLILVALFLILWWEKSFISFKFWFSPKLS